MHVISACRSLAILNAYLATLIEASEPSELLASVRSIAYYLKTAFED